MAALLPPIPRFVFGIFEPISLVAGAVAPFVDTAFFVTTQLPREKPHKLYPTEQILALQLGSLYFLLCLLGLAVLYTTTEHRVVHRYIAGLLFTDVTHIGVTAWVMGYNAFVDVRGWNATTYGNVAVTLGLLVTRVLYLAGMLGKDKGRVVKRKKKA